METLNECDTGCKELILFVNGELRKANVRKLSPRTTLNTYLREHLNLTGTKRLCLEGGCGTCVVSVSKRNPVTQTYEVVAVNSCLVSIFSCYGWEISTIEGIGNSDKPHFLQSAITTFNGSQCGYCTPGMIMNMFALAKSDKELTKEKVENSFSGNICRCTGYRSILAAFRSTVQEPIKEQIYPDIEDLSNCTRTQCSTCTGSDLPVYYKPKEIGWMRVYKYTDLLQILICFKTENRTYMLVAGNTARGVYKSDPEPSVYVDIQNVAELVQYELLKGSGLVLGGNISLAAAMKLFSEISNTNPEFAYLKKVSHHIDWIANVPVRNIGTLAGNLMIKHKHNDFPSDVFLILETVQASLTIVDTFDSETLVMPSEFLSMNMDYKMIKKITLPPFDGTYYYEYYDSFKIMPRAQNASSLVNAGFLLKMDEEFKVNKACIVYGGISADFIHATQTEIYLTGKILFDDAVLQTAFATLDKEIVPDYTPPSSQPDFRKKLAISLFYKYILRIVPDNLISERNLSGRKALERPLSTGIQSYETQKDMYPVSKPVSKIESVYQTTGEAQYLTDLADFPEQLHAAFVLSKATPNSKIVKIDTRFALNICGAIAFYDKNDIPGKNTFTPLEASFLATHPVEEELFCNETVKYYSQPIGVIVATSREIAERAADLVIVTYKEGVEKPYFNIRQVLKDNAKDRITQDMIQKPEKTGTDIIHTVKGKFDVNWQYHFHMETQYCNAVYKEDTLDLYATTQWMDLSQNAAAAILNIPANRVNVSVKRLGGAFGAKIVRNAMLAGAAALASFKLKKPVKIWLPLETNMKVMGKRTPMASDYEVATDANGVIQYLKNTFYADHGQGGNEDTMFLIFALMAAYNAETWYGNSSYVTTNMHSNAYMRAPGSLEGFAMMESIMEHTAVEIGMDPLAFRINNISTKDLRITDYINEFKVWAKMDDRKLEIEQFNKDHRWKKKGLSVVPMIYPLPMIFTYSVVVSIYHSDGSVAISHGGVEIGQGINTKVIQVCAYKLGIPMEKISVKPSNTFSSANSQMTGASLTSESVCWALIKACDILLARMQPIKDKMKDPTWEEIVKECFKKFVHLTAATKNSPLDPELKDYVAYCVCASEIELDVLTGQHQITRVDLLEDVGDSMNPLLDMGQVEGAFVMGVGYGTSEQIVVGENGEILTNRTWNYKPPGAKDIPIDFRIKFPGKNPNPVGVLHSKSVGEPPICLSVSVPLAIRQAVAAARTEADANATKWYPINGPSTVENIFVNCLHDYSQYTL